MTGVPDVEPLLGSYLARQHWAQAALGSFGEPRLPVSVVDVEVLRTEHPGLASVVVECRECTFHLVLGWRPTSLAPGVLGRHSDAVLGAACDSSGEVLVYDFLADRELAVWLLEAVTAGAETAERSRVVTSLVSHSSLVYDERLFMKCYRVIEPRPRLEIEVLQRLDAAGFNHMLAPVAHWRRDGRDLALVREYMPGAVEGLALARTSLRDLLARTWVDPRLTFEDVGVAGGDLGPEMRRLGETTARMHLALSTAFPTAAVPEGTAIRVHGDYHLRRVMRADAGWLIAGFGDDPLLGESAGAGSLRAPRLASPLEDVADFCESLLLAAAAAVELQPASLRTQAERLATGWERHNVAAFVRGYVSLPGIASLVPVAAAGADAVLSRVVGGGRGHRSGAG
ncbi:MAG: hypothetical protein ACRD0Z_06290 [Acidimicrobiales bacterium]